MSTRLQESSVTVKSINTRVYRGLSKGGEISFVRESSPVLARDKTNDRREVGREKRGLRAVCERTPAAAVYA